MTHNEYRDNLRAQIREFGKWLDQNADDIVMNVDGSTGIDIDCSFGGDNYMPEISIWSRFIDLEMVHGYDLREKWEQDA